MDIDQVTAHVHDDNVAATIESLGKLDAQTRAIVVLRCLLEYKPREIAGMVDPEPGGRANEASPRAS